ncbi:ABC transporter ATP-binding protein [Microbacterium sp. NPDC058345]|uniref:ABC transporter ATP-binding protein n=1 Tax=Microbacterium sp. NPDC058345 TaxID=3346455 RepID=UPI00364DCE18
MTGTAHDPILEMSHVTKTYQVGRSRAPIVAADDVSFSLRAGESLGVVGESGSGKSTVAKMVLGLTRPDSGSIRIAEKDRTVRVRGSRARLDRAKAVQMVFQDPYGSLDRRLTVTAALEDTLRRHHPQQSRSARSRTIAGLLEKVRLKPELAGSYPHQLSGGQRQRVAIAKALAVEPDVLVLDEAVSALDVSVQAQILTLLNDIRSTTGVALIFVSHDLAVVSQITDSVLVMYRGVVVESGSTHDVLVNPAHPYTEMLLSSAPGPGWRPERVAALRARFAAS